MGITVEQVLTIGGQTLSFNPGTDTADSICKFICDSPRCAARNGGESTFLTWSEESARQDIYALSDKYTGLIRINPNPWDMNHTVVVCCAQCAKDYFTFAYVPPKSPRQLKQEADERLKVNPETQAAIDALEDQLPLPFPIEIESVPDSTGVAE